MATPWTIFMATLRPLFSLGNKLFLRPANKGSGFLSMLQQQSNTTENDSKKGGSDSKGGEKDFKKLQTEFQEKKPIFTRGSPKGARKKPEKNPWGVLKEGLAENSALSLKFDQPYKKPEQMSALAQKFNQPLSQNVDQKKPEINSAISQESYQKQPKINSTLSQKVDQKKPEIYSDLSQKDNQKKPEKNSSYETELYYPNKTVSVPALTLSLSSTVNVTEQLKGTFLKLFQSVIICI